MTNPVQQRLRLLEEQWETFAASEARLLCWLIEDDDAAVLDAFFAVMQHESARRGELFVPLSVPFAPADHGTALIEELASHYRELEEMLREHGLRAGWAATRHGDDDIVELYRNAIEFVAAHRPLFDTLVLVLRPEQVSDAAAWQLWLARAAAYIGEPCVKLVALDSIEAPLLSRLVSEPSRHVLTQSPRLAMRNAYVEVSEGAGGLSTPAGAFRHAFVQLAKAISERDIAAAERCAHQALGAANGAGWLHLVVAVECALAGAYFGAERFVDAIACYHRAEQAADGCQPEPYAQRLKLTAQLGRGGAFIAAGAFHEAAQCYLEAVPVAQAVPDVRLELEALRMASYASECAGDHDLAWQEGLSALAVGQRMDEETRQSSTLAYAADGLCRIGKRPEYAPLVPRLEREIEKLLGTSWRKLLASGESS